MSYINKKWFKRLSKFEMTQIIGFRATQLEHGADILIETDKTDYLDIAYEELMAGKLDYTIQRKLPEGKIINVKLSSLNIIQL